MSANDTCMLGHSRLNKKWRTGFNVVALIVKSNGVNPIGNIGVLNCFKKLWVNVQSLFVLRVFGRRLGLLNNFDRDFISDVRMLR